MVGVLTKRENSKTDMHVGRTPRENEGRGRVKVLPNKEQQRRLGSHQRLGRGIEWIFPHSSQKEPIFPTLDLGLLASKTERQ